MYEWVCKVDALDSLWILVTEIHLNCPGLPSKCEIKFNRYININFHVDHLRQINSAVTKCCYNIIISKVNNYWRKVCSTGLLSNYKIEYDYKNSHSHPETSLGGLIFFLSFFTSFWYPSMSMSGEWLKNKQKCDVEMTF